MVDLNILEELGISPEAWQKLLEKPSRDETEKDMGNSLNAGDEEGGPKVKLKRLRNRIRSRINAGRDYNVANWQHYHVLDLLWDAPFRQISPTTVASITDKYKGTESGTFDALRALGMDLNQFELHSTQKDPKTGNTQFKLDVPAFFHVTVPLVRAYLKVRQAKLINDRNQDPLLKFKPAANTPEDRLRAEILTDMISVMNQQFGHLEDLNQGVFGMLLYHWSMMFPREEWYVEEALRTKEGAPPSTNGAPDPEFFSEENRDAIKKYQEYVTKQGIRYFHPHPTRTYYDQAFNPKTLNTDTGCTFCGHWKVLRFRELKEADGFYNLDKINIGANDWWNSAGAFLTAIFGTCYVSFPKLEGIKTPENTDRQAYLANNLYYTSEFDDQAVIVYEHYEKLVPSEDGLGDYPYPIWCRFTVAGDGTIIYAAPLGYCPAITFWDNGDDNRLEESSLGQELMPYQDQTTNMLTQYLLTVKQNLANLTLVDENVVAETTLDRIKNLGERFFRSLNIETFDSKGLFKGQYGVPQAIYSHRFPQLDTTGILQSIRTIIDLAERVLQFSSQEVAQAATHEQTRTEVNLIAATTNNILAYTGRPVDAAMEAMGRQQYEALMNYGEDDFIAHVPSEHNLSAKKLEGMGIEFLTKPREPGDKGQIKAKKTAMMLHWFAVTPNLHEREVDVQAAQALATFLRDLLNSPFAESIGADQTIMLTNQIAKLAGLPLPAPIRNTGLAGQGGGDEKQKQLLQGVVEEVLRQVKEGNQVMLESIKTNELLIESLYKQLRLPLPDVDGQPQTTREADGAADPAVAAST